MAKGTFTGGKLIKPGEVLNPAGRPPVPIEVRQMMNARRSEIAEDLCRLTTMKRHELVAIRDDMKAPALAQAIAAVIIKAAAGDVKALDCILDRIVGRIKEHKFSP